LRLICEAMGLAGAAELESRLPADHKLYVAREGGAVVAAAAAYPQAGRSCHVFPVGLAAGGDVTTGSALLRAMLDAFRAEGAVWCQSLLDPSDELGAAVLSHSGFILASRLQYLVSPVAAAPEHAPESSVEFLGLSSCDEQRLQDVIQRTYVGSQDCSEVGGWRDLRDVLAGYRSTGSYDPSRWFLVRRGDADVGCLLLTEHSDSLQWELLYMGVVPEARGGGLGRAMVRYGQWLAREAPSASMVLAVDAANTHAVEVYASCGFVTWAERSVWVDRFEDAPRDG
jgi:ribosomal protein S18 acetylase RimI-like enzyme